MIKNTKRQRGNTKTRLTTEAMYTDGDAHSLYYILLFISVYPNISTLLLILMFSLRIISFPYSHYPFFFFFFLMIRRVLSFSLFPSSALFFFFFNDTATTEIYTLSLHDALPISNAGALVPAAGGTRSPSPWKRSYKARYPCTCRGRISLRYISTAMRLLR